MDGVRGGRRGLTGDWRLLEESRRIPPTSSARQRLSGEHTCGPARWSARWNGFRGSTCDVDMSSPPAVKVAQTKSRERKKKR